MMIVSCVPLSSFFRPKTALIFGFWFSLHLPPYNPFFSPQNGDNSRFIIVILSHGESIPLLKKCTCSVRFVREKQLGCPANIGKRCSVDMIHGSICIGIPMDDIMRQCISKSNFHNLRLHLPSFQKGPSGDTLSGSFVSTLVLKDNISLYIK